MSDAPGAGIDFDGSLIVPRIPARCKSCGGELAELKNYAKPPDHGRQEFACLEPSCYARFYLDFGSIVEMRRLP